MSYQLQDYQYHYNKFDLHFFIISNLIEFIFILAWLVTVAATGIETSLKDLYFFQY